jgi:cytochrome c oxidase cbb3-type subunit 4
MDTSMASAWTTVVLFAVFIGIVFWAWSGRRRAAFDAAARAPLEDDDQGGAGGQAARHSGASK